jgi:2-iminobutanoate/2-iminopropanoate deaminase
MAAKKAKAKMTRRGTKSPNSAQKGNSLQFFTSPKLRPLPFSDAVRVGNLLYVSGQIGIDENFQLAPGGILAEAHRALENMSAVLKRNGSSLDQVIKCSVMLVDMNEWDAMNTVYVSFFDKNRLPARSAFAGSGLALGARVEIDCIAAIK